MNIQVPSLQRSLSDVVAELRGPPMTSESKLAETAFTPNKTKLLELAGNLPLQYFDGPDYCRVKDATGGDFALTVQPELMKLMEDALSSRQEVSVEEVAEFFRCAEFKAGCSYTARSRALLAKYSITKRTTEG